MTSDSYKIVFTRRAKDDLIDIGDYITYTLLEPNIARSLLFGLRDSIRNLADFPLRYPLVDDEVLKKSEYSLYYVWKLLCFL